MPGVAVRCVLPCPPELDSIVVQTHPRHAVVLCATAARGVQGAEQVIDLEPLSPSLPADLAQAWPHLAGCAALRVPAHAVREVGGSWGG